MTRTSCLLPSLRAQCVTDTRWGERAGEGEGERELPPPPPREKVVVE